MSVWTSTRLTDEHDAATFDSGQPSLDHWLQHQAERASRQGTALTWVWTEPESAVVVAYVSIAPTQVLRETVSAGQSGGVSVIPAYLIARLALDRSLHGQGLGGQLLRDALERIVRAAELAGGRLIVVDAIDEAAVGFYEHYGFVATRDGDTYPRRLIMKISTARAALGG